MLISFSHDRQVLGFVKNHDNFVLIYHNNAAGRGAAKAAVRDWLLNCELDFDRQDAEKFWKAIDASRLCATTDRLSESDMRWGWRRL